MEPIIGREKEIEELRNYIHSDKSEFVAIYGRRRVGKTFLVRHAVEDKFTFFITGVHGATKNEQLINFAIALQKCSKNSELKVEKNWLLAFYSLEKYIETLPEGPKILFFDELPWMDSQKSGFIRALENFWNSWAALRNDIKLIVCGSATSWIINKIIRDRGGLHNRVTHKIKVDPFHLKECEKYFNTYLFPFSRKQIAECYMTMGGIPYYFSLMKRDLSLSENIDMLFFQPDAPLKDEFSDLYRALFKNWEIYLKIVRCLGSKGVGLSRQEILKLTGITDNGAFSNILEELELCGFIRHYPSMIKRDSKNKPLRRKSREILYQLIDFYTLFYLKFIEKGKEKDCHFWSASYNTPILNAWRGQAFEKLCLCHYRELKEALGISAVNTTLYTWRSVKSEPGSQIDLVIDRADDTINLCEIKYYSNIFTIDKKYYMNLENKVDSFIEETKTLKAIILTMITTRGLLKNQYSSIVTRQVVLDELFK